MGCYFLLHSLGWGWLIKRTDKPLSFEEAGIQKFSNYVLCSPEAEGISSRLLPGTIQRLIQSVPSTQGPDQHKAIYDLKTVRWFYCLSQQTFPGDSSGKKSTCNAVNLGSPLGWEDGVKTKIALDKVKQLRMTSFWILQLERQTGLNSTKPKGRRGFKYQDELVEKHWRTTTVGS